VRRAIVCATDREQPQGRRSTSSPVSRSGSTLLAALLRQNPRFQAGMSGPLAGLFSALLGQMSARNDYSVFDVLLAEDRRPRSRVADGRR